MTKLEYDRTSRHDEHTRTYRHIEQNGTDRSNSSVAEEERAWEHFCRTGCIILGYAHVIAKRMREWREREQDG